MNFITLISTATYIAVSLLLHFHFFNYSSIYGIIISEEYCNFKKFDCFCQQFIAVFISKFFDINNKLFLSI